MTASRNLYYRGKKSDHFNGFVFFNPNGVEPRSFSDFMRWKLCGNKEKWPKHHPSIHDDVTPAKRIENGNTVITQGNRLNFGVTDYLFSESRV